MGGTQAPETRVYRQREPSSARSNAQQQRLRAALRLGSDVRRGSNRCAGWCSVAAGRGSEGAAHPSAGCQQRATDIERDDIARARAVRGRCASRGCRHRLAVKDTSGTHAGSAAAHGETVVSSGQPHDARRMKQAQLQCWRVFSRTHEEGAAAVLEETLRLQPWKGAAEGTG
jgi:hypothetical protein